MARTTRTTRPEGDDEEPRGRRAPAQRPFPVAPIAILVLLLCGALFFARQIAQSKKAKDSAPVVIDTGHKPFSSLPDEAPKSKGSSQSSGSGSSVQYDTPPVGLLATNQVWIDALKDATKAESLYAAALKAKQTNDYSGFRENGIAAKDLFSKVLEDTYMLEEEMVAEYGDRDPQVRDVIKKRTAWTSTLAALSKTTGR